MAGGEMGPRARAAAKHCRAASEKRAAILDEIQRERGGGRLEWCAIANRDALSGAGASQAARQEYAGNLSALLRNTKVSVIATRTAGTAGLAARYTFRGVASPRSLPVSSFAAGMRRDAACGGS
jgi:hypothetical protein